MTPSRKWIIHLDADAFAVAVERARGNAPPSQPVIIGDDAGGRGTVACVSYELRSRGIHAGMPMSWARWRAPEAIFLPRNMLAWETFARHIYEFLCESAPVVEMAGIDDFFLDMTGCERWCRGSISRWGGELLRRLHTATGVPFSAGIARTKMLAEIATRLTKPSGLTTVQAGAEEAFLHALPLFLTRIFTPSERRLLEECGCRRVGDIAALGREKLCALFGDRRGEEIFARLSGHYDEAVHPTRLSPALDVDYRFEPDTCAPDLIEAGLSYALERLGWELRNRGLRCSAMTFTGIYCDDMTVRRKVRLAYPTNQTHELVGAARGWTRLLLERRARVRLVHVRGHAETAGGTVLDFFEEEKLARTARLYEALDEIRARHGFLSIFSARALPVLKRSVLPLRSFSSQRTLRPKNGGGAKHKPHRYAAPSPLLAADASCRPGIPVARSDENANLFARSGSEESKWRAPSPHEERRKVL